MRGCRRRCICAHPRHVAAGRESTGSFRSLGRSVDHDARHRGVPVLTPPATTPSPAGTQTRAARSEPTTEGSCRWRVVAPHCRRQRRASRAPDRALGATGAHRACRLRRERVGAATQSTANSRPLNSAGQLPLFIVVGPCTSSGSTAAGSFYWWSRRTPIPTTPRSSWRLQRSRPTNPPSRICWRSRSRTQPMTGIGALSDASALFAGTAAATLRSHTNKHHAQHSPV